MTWLHPVAWIGAAAVVLPIAIHLLGRGHARVYRFPSLRFVRASRLLPTRRTTVHDPLLLLVRVLTLVAAAAALAQPLLVSQRGSGALDRLARVVIVDTNARMRSATDSARALARRLADSADAGVVISSASPSAAIGPAMAWAQRQPGRREVVVVSDFARGVVDASDVARIVTGFGIRMIRIAEPRAPSQDMTIARGDEAIDTRIDADRNGTRVRWLPIDGRVTPAVTLLAPPSAAADADAVVRAARQAGAPALLDSARHLTVVFAGSPGHDSLARGPLPHEPWMIDAFARLQSEAPDSPRHATQRGDTMFVFCDAPPASVTCASLVGGALRARAARQNAAVETEMLPDAQLAHWQRAPSAGTDVPRRDDWLTGPSNARWLWALVLVLLGIETLLRRSAKPVASVDAMESHERAA